MRMFFRGGIISTEVIVSKAAVRQSNRYTYARNMRREIIYKQDYLNFTSNVRVEAL